MVEQVIPDAGKLVELAGRVEGASSDQQETMLRQAFIAFYGPKPPRVHGGSIEWVDWLDLYNPFCRMLECNAFESAAVTLIPSTLRLVVLCDLANGEDRPWAAKLGFRDRPGGYPCSAGATPALALTAACLHAQASSDTAKSEGEV